MTEFIDPFEGKEKPRHPLSADERLVTKTGKVLTDEEIQALADEAERGYDIPSPPAGLVTAASLLPPDYDEDEGDFEPGGLYKGFEILAPSEWPEEAHRFPNATQGIVGHANQRSRFYVRHNDTVGLVPWPGSQIVWPWMEAWTQSLYRPEVESLLKEPKGK